MSKLCFAVVVIALGFSGAALAQTLAADGSLACQSDYDKYCKGTAPAGAIACLKQNPLNADCKQALATRKGSAGKTAGRRPTADNREALLTQLSRVSGVTEVTVSSGVPDSAASKLRRHHGKVSKKFAHSKKTGKGAKRTPIKSILRMSHNLIASAPLDFAMSSLRIARLCTSS